MTYIEHVHIGSAGPHVDAYRRMLAAWASVPDDRAGPFSEADAAVLRAFQTAEVSVKPTGAIGPATHAALMRWADATACALLTDEYARRHPEPTARQIVVEAALLALAKRGSLTYSGRGRETVARRWHAIDDALVPPEFPQFADCSSLATWCLWLARDHGAVDPSARDWAPGSTSTMEVHGRVVDLATALPGSMFFYVNHVTVMVERVRGVPFVVSFGEEGGPSYLRHDYRKDATSIRDYIA